MRNVEIKAKIRNPSELLSKVEKLSDTKCVVMKQHDTFFQSAQGRLKLREFEDKPSELIYYVRPNATGPKLCEYTRMLIDKGTSQQLKDILSRSNGVVGTVKKTRQLYMIGQTRVHIDEVDGLGYFMELEVVLSDNEDAKVGEKISQDIMLALEIGQDDLISEAYIDILNKVD